MFASGCCQECLSDCATHLAHLPYCFVEHMFIYSRSRKGGATVCGRAMQQVENTGEFSEQGLLTGVDWDEWGSVFNVSPGQRRPVVVEDWSRRPQAVGMYWGLIRKNAPTNDIKPFNARSETIATIPRFRDLLSQRRCLVPCAGWYEWRREGRRKQPYFAHPMDQQAFALAGLYTAWRNDAGEIIASYCIITTTPTPALAPLHDRMPVVLAPEDEQRWVSKDITDLAAVIPLLRPYDRAPIEWYPVSTAVNDTHVDGPHLVRPHLRGAELRGTYSGDFEGELSPRQTMLIGMD